MFPNFLSSVIQISKIRSNQLNCIHITQNHNHITCHHHLSVEKLLFRTKKKKKKKFLTGKKRRKTPQEELQFTNCTDKISNTNLNKCKVWIQGMTVQAAGFAKWGPSHPTTSLLQDIQSAVKHRRSE